MSILKDMIEKQFDDLYVRLVENKEIVSYKTTPSHISLEGTNPDMVVEFVEKYDETGDFDGYLEGNGVDQDWHVDMMVKGVKFHLWGSMKSGSCLCMSGW